MSLSIALVLAFVPIRSPAVHVLVHSMPIDEKLQKAIVGGPDALRARRDQLKLATVVVDRFEFFYPRDLYNMERFQRKLDGIAALTRLCATGDGSFTLSQLSMRERLGIWEFFRKGAFADQLGPLMERPEVTLVTARTDRVTFGAGQKRVELRSGKETERPASELAVPVPTKDELARYQTLKAATIERTDRGRELSFTFLNVEGSVSNFEAVEAFAVHLKGKLLSQNEQYEKSRVQLLASLPGETYASGSRLAAYPQLEAQGRRLCESWAANGFSSADEARGFVYEARVIGTESNISVGFFQRSGNRIDSFFQSTKIVRFGGP